VRSRELDLMISIGPFQLKIFYDSMQARECLEAVLASKNIGAFHIATN